MFNSNKDKESNGSFNMRGMIGTYVGLVIVTTGIILFIKGQDQFFFSLATGMILSWILVVIIYYIWAIHFYNVNMGWTNKDWKELRERKEKEGQGVLDDEPIRNPHAEETLGLPPGTVRGTIAVSLLVAGLAMIVGSFELDSSHDANNIYVDNFEFFKTAFLMMIAFYFGNKSLKAISERNQGVYMPGKKNSKDQGIVNENIQTEISGLANGPGGPTSLKNTLQEEKSPDQKKEDEFGPNDGVS